ncbi:DUF1036 domain-containing protein [Roseicyclus sp. F158]|uniref:DUF1036 domain-containing protein n=1 Tax=Tropicimonas omnivorans TaxID=3075590 RepID=A0ABU3DE66_9RHOB|nr:DUF1036 domain-containing protein [Roseicyclus sp. F158]MDT0681960.1 DUF1036 domain-containing protein [Roseicyclus sp. F158]
MPFRLALAAVAAILLMPAARAEAQFAICNQSFDVVNVAIGQSAGPDFETEGWWTIGTNQCANVIKDELRNRYIYVYAADVFGQPILAGTTPMCLGEARFEITGIAECWSRGHREAPFFEVDTQATERWTLFLTQRGLD